MNDIKPTKRKEQSLQTIEAIRSAVDRLVPIKGFENMTVRDICHEAGISSGTFYHHFKTKSELMIDRSIRTGDYFEQLYKSRLEQMKPLDALKELFNEWFIYIRSRVLPVLKHYIHTIMDHPEYTKNVVGVICRDLITKGQIDGTIRDDYSVDDILKMLDIILLGTSYCQCFRQGGLLEDDAVINQTLDWLETLRKSPF